MEAGTSHDQRQLDAEQLVSLGELRQAQTRVPSLVRFWSRLEGPFAIVYPGATPDEVVATVREGVPAAPKEDPDSLDYALTFAGDNNARDFISDILRRTYGSANLSCRLAQATQVRSAYQRWLAERNVVLIGSSKSNPLTGEALRLLAARDLEIEDRFRPNGIARLDDHRKTLVGPPASRDRWVADYGYVGRFPNPWTDAAKLSLERCLIIIAGHGAFGTQAAAAVLTVEETMRELVERQDVERHIVQGICKVTMPPGAETRTLSHSAEELSVRLVWGGKVSRSHILNRERVDECLDLLGVVIHAVPTQILRRLPPLPDRTHYHVGGALAYLAFAGASAYLFLDAVIRQGNSFPPILSLAFVILGLRFAANSLWDLRKSRARHRRGGHSNG